MTSLDWITAIASTATAIGVLIAVAQLWHAKNLASAQFEDELQREYRNLCGQLPVKAFLGDALTEEELKSALSDFYRYFHLSNSQLFLWSQGRISTETWQMWANGMAGNFELPAFQQAWDAINTTANVHRLGKLKQFLTERRAGPTEADLNTPTK